MAITYTIPGATLLDQLDPATLDGLPNNDAQDDCVGESVAEVLHILTGGAFDGDMVKDAVYGAGYVGFESASAYVQYCANYGVQLSAHNDTQAGLIATLHAEVSAGHPVLVTMPSMWGTAPADPVHPSGSTHVGVAVGIGAGEIRIMNPWHGFWQDQADAWWEPRLCYGQIWIARKSGGSAAMLTHNADGSATDPANGNHVGAGIAADIWRHGWESAGLLTGEFYFTAHESAAALSNGVVEHWNGNGVDQNGAAVVAALHGAIGAATQARDAIAAQLQQTQGQVAQLQQQVQQLQSQPAPAPAPPTAAQQAADALVQAIRNAIA